MQAESYFSFLLKAESCRKAGRKPVGDLMSRFDGERDKN